MVVVRVGISGVSEGRGCRIVDSVRSGGQIVEIELSRVAWWSNCSMN